MTALDWVTIALYFGLLLGLTWWSVLRNRNTAEDYFLAGLRPRLGRRRGMDRRSQPAWRLA